MQITRGVDVFEPTSKPVGNGVFRRWLASNIWYVRKAWQRRAMQTRRAYYYLAGDTCRARYRHAMQTNYLAAFLTRTKPLDGT